MLKESVKFAESNIFEGIVSLRAILSAMESGISDRKIKKVYYSASKAEKSEKELNWLKHRSGDYGFEIVLSEDSVINGMTLGTSHGGIVTEATERHIPLLTEESRIDGKYFVLLDGVEDPYNFGYALRTLYAAGCDAVFLNPRNWLSAAGVVCRASAGASELLPMYIAENDTAAAFCRTNQIRLVCAEIEDSVPLYDAELKLPLLLAVGGEKRGLSKTLKNQCDIRIRIDYARKFDGELSAASAASVIAYEIFRQNR